jgi:hypothetical protein
VTRLAEPPTRSAVSSDALRPSWLGQSLSDASAVLICTLTLPSGTAMGWQSSQVRATYSGTAMSCLLGHPHRSDTQT